MTLRCLSAHDTALRIVDIASVLSVIRGSESTGTR